MVISSVLNVRPIGGELLSRKSEHDADQGNTLNVKVYRSGRLDNVTEEDLQYIANDLGIRAVFDLRNFEQEYGMTDGEKLLDCGNRVRAIDVNRTTNDKFRWIDVSKYQTRNRSENVKHNIQHTFVDFSSISMILGMMKRSLSFFQLVQGIFLLFMYILFTTKHFKRFLEKKVINKIDVLLLYKCIIDYDKVPICSALRLMNDWGSLPCIICCQAGKDRTGILSALLLSIIGISNAEIAKDYSLSSIGIPESHSELKKYSEQLRKADADTMLSLLRYIEDRYRSVPDFLSSVGFSYGEQEELRKKILFNDTEM